MVVLGIDPGSRVTGFGIVRLARGRLRLVTGGCVRTRPDASVDQRLLSIHDGLREVFGAHPEVTGVAIETVFHHRSAESALRLGQARGVALLTAAQAGHRPVDYNPRTVKRTIGAHGSADKAAIARVVQMLLGEPLPPGPADVADALAIAITHISHARNGAVA